MTADEYKHRTGGLFDISKGDRELDFGGFAKGYLLKELKSVLPQGGIKSAFVDFGGSSILAAGRHPYGDCWKVGVRDPFSGGVVREIELKDQSMSTSGNSPGYSGHIINPATGMQVEGRKMVTVISEDPLEAEVLSTAAMVAGAEALHRLELAFPDSKFICFEEDSMR